MDKDLTALRRHLGRLAVRERALLVGRAALQVLAALLAAAALASALLSAGLGRVPALGWVAALGGLLAWSALAWPLIGRWRLAGDPLEQARALERLLPDLRSRLLTAMERAPEVEAGTARFSVPLWARALGQARAVAESASPARVHSARALGTAGALLGGAALLALLAGVLLPIGPAQAMAALWSGSTAEARLEAAEPIPPGERALVGDIVLRYVYPDYTGLAPVEIPNSDGTVHAPPGTQVTITARTAEPFEAAAIQAYDEAPVEVLLRGGRDLSATLLVRGEGTWRFLLFQGRDARSSPDYRIEVEPDAPPVVTTDQDSAESAVDQPIPLAWQAEDDYGIDRVVVEVEIDGRVTELVLRDPLDVSRALAGQLGKTPRELGLRPGDEATLRVAAWDNDPVAGSKKGASAEVKLSVIGPRGRSARLAQYHLALRDALLVALADFLEDPMPPGEDAEALSRWGEGARGRLDRVREIVEDEWRGEVPGGIDGTLVQRVLESAARLLRFTQTAFDPSAGRAPSERDLATFADLHAQQVASLEMAVWMLDSLLRADALQKVAERAENVAQEASEILEMVNADASASELLSRLDQLERLMQRLGEEASRLAEGQLREFVNARSREAQDMISQIREAIARGQMDEAKEMMERLAEMLEQMAEGLGEQLAASQETDDQLSQRLEQLQRDLEQLEKDQDALADSLAKTRQQEGAGVQKVVSAWEKLDPLAERARGLACSAATRPGEGTGWRVGTIRKLDMLCEAGRDLQGAVRARDVERSIGALESAELQHRMGGDLVANERSRPRGERDPVPPGVELASGDLTALKPVLAEIRKLLDQLARQNVAMSPEMQKAARELAQRQAEIGRRGDQLSQEVQAAERAMPTGDGSAQRAMEQAGASMEQAEDALEDGDALGGEGHQRHAADQVAEARRVLQRQQEEARQMQAAMAAMQGKSGGDKGGQSRGRQSESMSQRQIEIPAPETFQTPEAYRKALLEGMEAEVPDEYQALKQRYYEELVRQ